MAREDDLHRCSLDLSPEDWARYVAVRNRLVSEGPTDNSVAAVAARKKSGLKRITLPPPAPHHHQGGDW